MHTIGGKPAFFDGEQISYAGSSLKSSKMANSLYQIRREVEMARKYRKEQGWDSSSGDYGYMIIKLGNSDNQEVAAYLQKHWFKLLWRKLNNHDK